MLRFSRTENGGTHCILFLWKETVNQINILVICLNKFKSEQTEMIIIAIGTYIQTIVMHLFEAKLSNGV